MFYIILIRIIIAIALISFGAFWIVYGEADDSPGGQFLGLIFAVIGIVIIYRSYMNSRRNNQPKAD